MVNDDKNSAPPGRSPQQRERRRNLVDAASGVERFRVLIYLCTTPNTDSTALRAECEDYAATFGWTVTGVVEDRSGLLPPKGRDGLTSAIERIRAREAGAILTPYRSMISPRYDEYHAVSAVIEKAGGFLTAMTGPMTTLAADTADAADAADTAAQPDG